MILASISRTGFPVSIAVELAIAAKPLPSRFLGVAQVRICLGECLAFHSLIVANQVANPQHVTPIKHGRSQS